MLMTLNDLKGFIQRAEVEGACEEDIEALKELKTIEEFFNHNKCPYWLYWYTYNVLKERWSEAEPTILKSSFHSYFYAKDIIKGRWPEAEDTIKKEILFCYNYKNLKCINTLYNI